MNIFKRTLSIVLLFCLLVFPLVNTASAVDASCGDSLTWSYDDSTKTLTISGSGEMTDYYNNRKVPWKSVRSEAENVVLPSGITSIGSYAFFKFEKLKEITIPKGITKIGNGAFGGCTSLSRIVLPETVKSIEGWTFGGCTSLSYIKLPSSLTSINYECFLGCESLMDVTIPSASTSIGGYAFGYLKSHAYNYDMIIRGVPGSSAQSYAQSNKLNFISVYSSQTLTSKQAAELTTAFTYPYSITEVDINADGVFSSRDILVSLKGEQNN